MEDKINILLIEDNKADSRLISIYLKEAFASQVTLSVAENLKKGLVQLSENEFDIIIIDLSLPDSAGIDTFKSVYEAAFEKPIIVLTGLEDESVGINTVKLGAQDFLIKGKLDVTLLKRAVNYSIERYKLLKKLSENAKMLEEKTADLLREKHKLALAQKLAHIGSWEWSLKDNTFACSEELFHILGIEPRGGMSYEEFLEFIYPEDLNKVKGLFAKALDRKEPFDFFHRIIRSDEEIRDIRTRGEFITDAEGNLSRIIGTEQDITERKKEEQLEQLAMVATKSYNAVTIAGKDGKIEWVNEGFTKLFGYTLEDVKGTYGEILTRGEKTGLSPEAACYKALIEKKKPLSYENKNYSKDGKEYWVLTSLTPILDEKGNVHKIISIDSDITKQKKAEQELIIANKIAEHSLYKGSMALEELHKAKKELEESLKVKEQFLANMSHEIRTPMNAIIGFTNLLLKTELNPSSLQYLNAIKTSGENLLVIINDILDFSKLESGKITFESIGFRLPQLVAMFVELVLPRAVEKNIKLSTAIDKKIPESIVGDPTRLNQILINLVGNAIKFTTKGEVKLTITLTEETQDEIELEFAVSDTGIGIPEESMNKIFESFTQASNDTTRKYGGTGLGLSITRQLVELQGGKIAVKSKVGQGSVFSFRLKFKKDEGKETALSYDTKENLEKLPLDGVRVLLVEDNSFNQILAAKILENWHCDVELADNGLIAIEKAEKLNFDVILMDIQLPEMDGYEATSYIRNKISLPKRNTPIIAMTAHAFANERDKCLKAGMNDYISKPFDENKLYSKIISVLQKPDEKESLPSKNGHAKTSAQRKKRINLSYLEKVANGDLRFTLKMISVFISQTPILLNTMRVNIENKDWKSLKAVVHRMKPSVTFMGIKELEDVVNFMEINLEKGTGLDRMEGMYNNMHRICTEAIEELEEVKKKIEEQFLSI